MADSPELALAKKFVAAMRAAGPDFTSQDGVNLYANYAFAAQVGIDGAISPWVYFSPLNSILMQAIQTAAPIMEKDELKSLETNQGDFRMWTVQDDKAGQSILVRIITSTTLNAMSHSTPQQIVWPNHGAELQLTPMVQAGLNAVFASSEPV